MDSELVVAPVEPLVVAEAALDLDRLSRLADAAFGGPRSTTS